MTPQSTKLWATFLAWLTNGEIMLNEKSNNNMSDKIYEFDNSKFDENWKELVQEMFMGVPLKDDDPRWKEKAEAHSNKMLSTLVGRVVNTEERKYWEKRTFAIESINKLLKMLSMPKDMREFLPEALKEMFLCNDYMVSLLTRMRNVAVEELKEKNLFNG